MAEGREFIELNGQRKHIIGYLQDFLFSPERARAPITRLSGGERNRLLLAKLFAQPSNLLVMDEPTNDLDVETLELLEELLTDYQGTLLLVTHDRAFLDNVVTSTLVLEGERPDRRIRRRLHRLVAPAPDRRGRGCRRGGETRTHPRASHRRGRHRSASSASRTSANWNNCRHASNSSKPESLPTPKR